MESEVIGSRLKHIRIERGMSQEDLCSIFGFKDRQTISAIETGVRRMSAQELITAIDKLGVSIEYFSDPFLLIGEGEFSWRHQGVSKDALHEYEKSAGRWIAIYRTLASQFGRKRSFIRPSLGLSKRSSYEDAMMAGEQFVEEFDLGDRPALRLVECMEQDLDILVLTVETCRGLSGAACRLPDLATVLISRNEVEGRRNFNLAHELFHILTWDAMPLDYSENSSDFGGTRSEQLADNFAGALLMPSTTLNQHKDWRISNVNELASRLNSVADELHVTSTALSWRLVGLGQLNKSVVRSLPEAALRNNGRCSNEGDKPNQLSRPYAQVIAQALEQGVVSARRVAKLLELTLDELNELFEAHDLDYRLEL